MNYLFFDIECADGTHMCSFGYVLVDEKFNILEKDDILINPKCAFRLGRDEFDHKIRTNRTKPVSPSPKFPYQPLGTGTAGKITQSPGTHPQCCSELGGRKEAAWGCHLKDKPTPSVLGEGARGVWGRAMPRARSGAQGRN